MAKTKVSELATELKLDPQQLVDQINKLNLGVTVKTPTSSLTDEQADTVRKTLTRQQRLANGGASVRVRKRTSEKAPAEKPAASETPSPDAGGPVGLSKMRAQQSSSSKTATKAESKTESKAKSDKSVKSEEKAGSTNAKAASSVKAEVVKAETEKVESKSEAVKVEAVKAESTKPEATKAEASKSEVVKAEGAKAESTKSEAVKAEATKSEAVKAESTKSEAVKVEATKPEGAKAEAQPAKKASDNKNSKDDKKGRKKDKRENVIELSMGNKWETTISLGGNFSDELPDAYGDKSYSNESDDYDDEDVEVIEKPKSKIKKSVQPASDARSSEEEFEYEDKKKAARPSNITGTIDPALIRAMLVKDNKKFNGNGAAAEKNSKHSGARTVVNSNQIYGAGNQRTAHAGGNVPPQQQFVKKGKKGKNVPQAPQQPVHTVASEHKRVVRMSGNISVGDIAKQMGVKAAEVMKYLMKELGMMLTVNQTIDLETAELVAAEHGYTVQDTSFKEEAFTESTEDRPEDLELRPPIVTVMGHVDHGKTSLLDAIRNTRVTAGEAGGITQHIGASSIETKNGRVVFLDTPGHEAFTALRARGAKVTDLVVLVVAADDGIMPQTIEAINHAKAAKVPIIVAINKIDKAGANPERVKQALTEYGLVPEDWGGETIVKEVSAHTGEGVDELLELIYLQSEVLELKANPDKEARGILLEAYKDARRGIVASIIVHEGTLHVNDIIVSGACYGKVKSMLSDKGKGIKVAGPSTPVEITGLSDIPEAGEPFFVTKSEKIAKEFTTQVKERKRIAELSKTRASGIDPWAQFNENKQLNVIIKADVQGSLEALDKSLCELSTDEVTLNVVHSAVGGATESDIQLAVASNALIVGFNTRPEARAAEIAKREGVIVESFSIIYEIIDYIKNAMSGLLDPILGENVLGHVEIRNTFNVPKVGTIAGGYVLDGIIRRNAKCRLLRNGIVIYDSKVASLKRFKDDAKEVRVGYECGFSIDNYNDIKVGDQVEVYEITETKQSL